MVEGGKFGNEKLTRQSNYSSGSLIEFFNSYSTLHS